MTTHPWRGKQFLGGYSAEYQPVGQRSFRIVKEAGKVKVFPTSREALRAAQDAFLATVSGSVRSTLPFDADRAERRMAADAEDFLRIKRGAKSETIRKPGGKSFQVVHGSQR